MSKQQQQRLLSFKFHRVYLYRPVPRRQTLVSAEPQKQHNKNMVESTSHPPPPLCCCSVRVLIRVERCASWKMAAWGRIIISPDNSPFGRNSNQLHSLHKYKTRRRCRVLALIPFSNAGPLHSPNSSPVKAELLLLFILLPSTFNLSGQLDGYSIHEKRRGIIFTFKCFIAFEQIGDWNCIPCSLAVHQGCRVVQYSNKLTAFWTEQWKSLLLNKNKYALYHQNLPGIYLLNRASRVVHRAHNRLMDKPTCTHCNSISII